MNENKIPNKEELFKDFRMPSEEELAEIVYKYCRTNNIKYIREDELVKKIVEEEQNNHLEMMKDNLDLDENGWGEDKESFDAITIGLGNYLMFAYKLTKRFYDVIDVLIEANKASREEKEGEKFYYLTFYLSTYEIESNRLYKSTIEIFANDLYSYCKENSIEYLKMDDVKNIIDLDDDEMIDKAIDVLIKKDKAMIHWIEDECYLIMFLTESKIALNKNVKLMIKNAAEAFLDTCNQNDITYIEKEKIKETMGAGDDTTFELMLDYLVERHLADVDYNEEDNKEYITIYI